MENEELQINPDETPLDIENQDELFDTLREAFILLDKWENLIVPFTRDLEETYQELFEHQYPGIKPYRQLWHINWVKEAMKFLASELCDQLVDFFETVAEGNDYKKVSADEYLKTRYYYFNRYEPKRRTFRGNRATLLPRILASMEARFEENYQEDIIIMKELRKLRDEYVEAVSKVVSVYFNEDVAALSPDQSIHLRLLYYIYYEEFFEENQNLSDYLIKRNMIEFPGVGFFQFKVDEWNRVHGK
jgi:hypothetical protein